LKNTQTQKLQTINKCKPFNEITKKISISTNLNNKYSKQEFKLFHIIKDREKERVREGEREREKSSII